MHSSQKQIVSTAVLITSLAMLFITGCHIDAPKARYGTLPSNTFLTTYPHPDKLGSHGYRINLTETNGLVYTCKAGHIDIYHVRGAADNTRHFANLTRKTLIKGKDGFSYNFTLEMSVHKLTFTYPPDWDEKSKTEKAQIAEKVSYIVAPYVVHNATVWHEILTWYGTNFAVIDPEFNSAFSWEDTYSNIIGINLAVWSLQHPELSYDKAMTQGLYDELERLNVQSKEVAIKASNLVKETWYKGYFIPDTLMRNFDIGLDGTVTPTLIPGITECGDEPLPIAVPTLEGLDRYGIELEYEIKPNVLEQWDIFEAAGSKRIFPHKHFAPIMDDVIERAKERGDQFDQ